MANEKTPHERGGVDKKLTLSEVREIGTQDAEALLELYVNGNSGFSVTDRGKVLIGGAAIERVLFANLYLMLRDLCKSCDKNTCNSDQSAGDRDDQ